MAALITDCADTQADLALNCTQTASSSGHSLTTKLKLTVVTYTASEAPAQPAHPQPALRALVYILAGIAALKSDRADSHADPELYCPHIAYLPSRLTGYIKLLYTYVQPRSKVNQLSTNSTNLRTRIQIAHSRRHFPLNT